MRGNITRRGKSSWRLKFDVFRHADGRRETRYVPVKGKRQDAQKELEPVYWRRPTPAYYRSRAE
jgi:hypothetical protein